MFISSFLTFRNPPNSMATGAIGGSPPAGAEAESLAVQVHHIAEE